MKDGNDVEFLIKKAVSGNTDAFEELIKNYEKIVYNIAYKMLNNSEDAKDISQEVFIKIYRNLSKFDGKSLFSTWVYRITMNTCIDELRKRKGKEVYSMDEDIEKEESSIKKQFVDEKGTPEDFYISREKQQEIINSINMLKDEHKQIIILRDINGFEYTQIAQILGISLGTVKSRIARARIQLKNLISNREHIGYGNRQNIVKGGKKNEV